MRRQEKLQPALCLKLVRLGIYHLDSEATKASPLVFSLLVVMFIVADEIPCLFVSIFLVYFSSDVGKWLLGSLCLFMDRVVSDAIESFSLSLFPLLSLSLLLRSSANTSHQ